MPITGSDGTAVALLLPVAHTLAPRLQLPRARHEVVVAERLTECGTQFGVRAEGRDRALERAGERLQVLPLRCVALHRGRRLGLAADAVGRRGHESRERQV